MPSSQAEFNNQAKGERDLTCPKKAILTFDHAKAK